MSSYFSKLSALLLITVFALSACTKSPELSGNPDAIESESYTARSGGASLIQNAQGRNIQDAWIVVLQDDVQNVEGEVEQLTRGLVGAKADHIYKHTIKGFSIKVPEVAIRGLLNNPKVKYIEQDQIVTFDATQTGATWGIDRTDQRSLPLNGSYTYNTDGSTVDAYIFDTGILLNHNEFTGRVRTGFDAITSGGNANDGNGHGSHVAGTVGGTLYGIAKRVSLVAVKVLGDSGSGTLSGVVAGVDWAAGDHTTKPAVGNMSLGSGFSQTVNDAVKRAVADGIVMVVAAGNNNANAANYSPASTLEAITVGATTSTDARASYSNFGSVLDIFAPGSSITSAWYTSSTATSTISGTSMASPHVAGVAALYLEAYPGSTPAQVQDGLKASATANVVTSPGTGSPNLLLFSGSFSGGGGGTPTAPAAPALLSPTNGATGRPITNSAVSWSTSAGATSYTVELSTSTSFATPLQSQTGLTATSASFSGLTALTTYYWRVGATNSVGTTWSATWSFTTALAVPTLSLPSNAAINVPLTPTFTWNSTGA
ncbi:MAG: hypothetical protein RL447_1076, partial [Bacteroidota bacterium]